MDSTSPGDGASAAASPAPAPASAPAGADGDAPAPRSKLSPKLLIVAGAATLLLGLGGAAAALLWPTAKETPTRSVKAAKASKAAGAGKKNKSIAVSYDGAASAPSALAAASAPDVPASASATAAASDGPPPVDAIPAAAQDSAASHIAPDVPVAHAADEPPIDRLRRRLGEVINGKGQLEAVASGDLRLRTRATPDTALKPASHGTAPSSARTATSHAAHWGYEGKTGPQAWGRMKPEFTACATGQRQSPIDIRDGLALDLEALQFDYRVSAFGVIDTGHTVQVNVAPGNFIDALGKRWQLQQFHFHRPSEERIDGRRFDMVVHLVHKNDEGRLAVLAVLLERGAAQPLLQTVWNNLPLEKGEEVAARALLDLNPLLPEDRRYYAYMGSLTTPPCSEGVLWLVLQQPVQLSDRQIDIFSRLYPMNARPLQSAAGRMIKQSN